MPVLQFSQERKLAGAHSGGQSFYKENSQVQHGKLRICIYHVLHTTLSFVMVIFTLRTHILLIQASYKGHCS